MLQMSFIENIPIFSTGRLFKEQENYPVNAAFNK